MGDYFVQNMQDTVSVILIAPVSEMALNGNKLFPDLFICKRHNLPVASSFRERQTLSVHIWDEELTRNETRNLLYYIQRRVIPLIIHPVLSAKLLLHSLNVSLKKHRIYRFSVLRTNRHFLLPDFFRLPQSTVFQVLH